MQAIEIEQISLKVFRKRKYLTKRASIRLIKKERVDLNKSALVHLTSSVTIFILDKKVAVFIVLCRTLPEKS